MREKKCEINLILISALRLVAHDLSKDILLNFFEEFTANFAYFSRQILLGLIKVFHRDEISGDLAIFREIPRIWSVFPKIERNMGILTCHILSSEGPSNHCAGAASAT